MKNSLRDKLLEVSRNIDARLSEVILLQRDHVSRICSVCEEPCCKRVQHLFDEKDIIFARVSRGEDIPRTRTRNKKGCVFLSPTGCVLTPKARPFICHRYLCSMLKEEMARQEPGLLETFERKFRVLEDLRAKLFAEYIDALSNGPESSEAYPSTEAFKEIS